MEEGGGEMEGKGGGREEGGGSEEEGRGKERGGGRKEEGGGEEGRGREEEGGKLGGKRRWKVFERMRSCFFWRREKRMVGRRIFVDVGRNFQWKNDLKRRRFSERTKFKRQNLRVF